MTACRPDGLVLERGRVRKHAVFGAVVGLTQVGHERYAKGMGALNAPIESGLLVSS